MHSHARRNDASVQDHYTVERFVNNQLEYLGLGDTTDLLDLPGPSISDSSSFSFKRRRGRSFSPIEATIVV